MRLYLCVFTLLLLLVGCENASDGLSDRGSFYPRTAYGPYNASNPYDSTGIKHNDALDNIYGYYQSSDVTLNACFSAIKSGLVNLYAGSGLSQGEIENELDTMRTIMDTYLSDYDSFVLYIESFQDPNYSQFEQESIQRVAHIVQQFTSTAALKDSLLQLESDMLSGGLSNGDLSLMSFSVLKHSVYYWSDIYPEGMGKRGYRSFYKRSDYPLQIIIDLADYVGALVGKEACRRKGISQENPLHEIIVGLWSSGVSAYVEAAIIEAIGGNLPPDHQNN